MAAVQAMPAPAHPLEEGKPPLDPSFQSIKKVKLKSDKPHTRKPHPVKPSTVPGGLSGNYEHRHYQAMHPTCNKLLAVRWESYVFEIHRRNLKKARHTIDDSRPKVYKHLDMRLKKTQTEEERMHTIEKNNNILFNRIMSQKLRDTDVSSISDSRAFDKRRDHIHEAHTHIRQCRNDNILKDNLTILQRIEEKAPNYNRLAWYSDRLRNLGYLCNIAEYPKHYLDQLEEGKPHYDLVRPKTHEITYMQKKGNNNAAFNARKSQTAPEQDTTSSTLLRPKTRGHPTSSPLLGDSQSTSAAASVIAGGAENNDTDSSQQPVDPKATESPSQGASETLAAANAVPPSPKQTPASKSTSFRSTPKQTSFATISRQDSITKAAATPQKSSTAVSPRKQTSQIQLHNSSAPTTPTTQKSVANLLATATPSDAGTPKKQLSTATLDQKTPKSFTPKHAASTPSHHSPRKSSLAGTPAKQSSVKQSRQPSQQILTQKSSKLPSKAASILLADTTAFTAEEEEPSWVEKTYSQHSLTDNRPARWMEDEASAKAAITMSDDDLADLGIVDCNSSSESVDAAAAAAVSSDDGRGAAVKPVGPLVVAAKEGSRPSSGWSEFDDASPEGEDSVMALNESTVLDGDVGGVGGEGEAGVVDSEDVVKIPNALFDDGAVGDGAAIQLMNDESQMEGEEDGFNYEVDAAHEEIDALDEMTSEQLEAKLELETVEREAIEKSNEYYSQEEATGQMEALIDQLGELIQAGMEGEETGSGGDASKVLEEHLFDQIPESHGHLAHDSEPKKESNTHAPETGYEALADHDETTALHNLENAYDADEFQNDAEDGVELDGQYDDSFGQKDQVHEDMQQHPSHPVDQNDEFHHEGATKSHSDDHKDTELDMAGENESVTNEYSPEYEADDNLEGDAGQFEHHEDNFDTDAPTQPVEPSAAEHVEMADATAVQDANNDSESEYADEYEPLEKDTQNPADFTDAKADETGMYTLTEKAEGEEIISDAIKEPHIGSQEENSLEVAGDIVEKEYAPSCHDDDQDKASNHAEAEVGDPSSNNADGPSIEPEATLESAEDDLQFKRSAPLPPIDSTGTRPTSSKSHAEQASLSRPISARVLGPIPTPPRGSKPSSRPVSGFHHSSHELSGPSKRASLPDLVKTDSAPSSRPLSAMRPVLSHVGSAADVVAAHDAPVKPSSLFTGSPAASKRASKTQSARLSKTASIAALEHSASPVLSRSRPFSGATSSSAVIHRDQDVDAVRKSISNIVASSASKMSLESAVMGEVKKSEFSKSPSKEALKSSSSTQPVSGVASKVDVQRSSKTHSRTVSKSASVSTISKSRVASEQSHHDQIKSSNHGFSSKIGSVKASRAQSAVLGKETESEEHDALMHESSEADEKHPETENTTEAASHHDVAQEDPHAHDADVIQSAQEDRLNSMTSKDDIHDAVHSDSSEVEPSAMEVGELHSLSTDNETNGMTFANEAESNPDDEDIKPAEHASQLTEHLPSAPTDTDEIASVIADDSAHQTSHEAEIVPSDSEAAVPDQSLGAAENAHLETTEDTAELLPVADHSTDEIQHETSSDAAESTNPPNHDTIQDTRESSHHDEPEHLSPASKPASATSKKPQSNYVSNSGTPKGQNTPKKQLSRPGSKSKLGKGASLSDLVPLK
ncbi:hypothetical protein CcCBS67573_g09127 [Chytriomyces confervae]|uniref:Uncharacterized protein n=1 Tax=Chytriomyces confervae TaxID=246404 RepID=A0A507E432_9FUNG|nr:hypothetical protein CcCBS67573_g09127 [Chytriomyces confervae]